MDSFEEIDENWNGEKEEELFTGHTSSAMAWQVLSNWEPMPADQGIMARETEHPWEVMPETATPVVYNIHIPNYDALNKFIPHDPKKKTVNEVKPDEKRHAVFGRIWVKPIQLTKEEDGMAGDLLEYDP